ncbi:MAG TPA: cytochrome c [Gammaproteobacteria bacterium]|nr:cytochrome c [Gammaproteobacteria bacterium]
MANPDPWWAREKFWRTAAIVITGGMAVALIFLTFDTYPAIEAGGSKVPPYTVINKRIGYQYDSDLKRQVPVIGGEAPLFGEKRSPAEARAMVSKGKKIVQGRNCMDCHTLLGNGAYYAPDLTKSWLDPAWGSPAARESMMVSFLQDPPKYGRGYGSDRRMPDLGISEQEARSVVAFLKWMSAIDTNGFPANFPTIRQ